MVGVRSMWGVVDDFVVLLDYLCLGFPGSFGFVWGWYNMPYWLISGFGCGAWFSWLDGGLDGLGVWALFREFLVFGGLGVWRWSSVWGVC